MSFSRRSRAVLALAVSHWLPRCYLAAVVLTAGYALLEDLFVTQADASMSYVAPMLLTAPLNLLFMMALGRLPTDAPFYLGLLAGAVVNAALLGAVVRTLRDRRASASSPRPAPGA